MGGVCLCKISALILVKHRREGEGVNDIDYVMHSAVYSASCTVGDNITIMLHY